jgi:hypothetical protein
MIPNDTMMPADFPVWRTIKLGMYQSGAAYLEALSEDGFAVDDRAKLVLQSPDFVCAPEPTLVDLIVAPGTEFFFERIAYRNELQERAQEEFGLLLCPAEVGPVLRLSLFEQKANEILYVEMDPITVYVDDRDLGHQRATFAVVNLQYGNTFIKELRGWNGKPDHAYRPEHLHVFMRPRPK